MIKITNLPTEDSFPEYDTSITKYLFSIIPKEELDKKRKFMDISCDFLGFVDIYYYLSKVIPKDWTVIDFGAGYNPQSYFFINHKEYIAINPHEGYDNEMFCPNNCKIYRMTTKDYLEKIDYPKGDKVFSICNYVPDWYGHSSIDLVKKSFKNVFTFYP